MTNQEIEEQIKQLKELKKQNDAQSSESFDSKKLISGMTNITSKVLWAKEFSWLFNLRKLIIILLILGGIYGYGYWKGKINKPVNLVIDESVEFTIPVPNSSLALYKAKHSTQLQWININTGKTISTVKVSEIPQLKKLLKPYGLQFKPIGVLGGGIGESGASVEGGVGISFAKWFQLNADTFLTNRGLYLGASYKLDNFKLNNSSIGLGVGKGYKGDNRAILYYRWEF